MLAARLTIKGPNQALKWEFSTNVVFRLEYTGFGLSDQNKLRIISPDGKCSDNARNPDKGELIVVALAFLYLVLDAVSLR